MSVNFPEARALSQLVTAVLIFFWNLSNTHSSCLCYMLSIARECLIGSDDGRLITPIQFVNRWLLSFARMAIRMGKWMLGSTRAGGWSVCGVCNYIALLHYIPSFTSPRIQICWWFCCLNHARQARSCHTPPPIKSSKHPQLVPHNAPH